jgi:glycosyltransferase involved in cell wall biosynthesis
MSGARPARRLGVILSQFPRYDEAFILRDLQALSAGFPGMVIFSLRPCRDEVVHAQAKQLLPQTLYAPFLFSMKVWESQAWFLRRRARAYTEALAWIARHHWRNPIVLIKTLILFPKTVHFAQQAQEKGIELLHAGWATYPATSAWIIQELTGIPFTVAGHAHDLYTANPSLAAKLSRARFVVTCTEDNKLYLDRLTQGRVRVHVSYHGVDLSRFAPLPKPAQGPCRILVVGSLLPCKGLETLIAGCALLSARGVAFDCTLAGGGPLEKKLRALIAKHRLADRVRITGFVTQEVVIGLYQQAHVFVLPLVSKIHWGIPNVVIEALATKTPVVCCDLPSMKELVRHNQTGWIIPESDPQGVAGAVQRLWNDPALRLRLADAGSARVTELFSLDRTGQALRALFAEAMA